MYRPAHFQEFLYVTPAADAQIAFLFSTVDVHARLKAALIFENHGTTDQVIEFYKSNDPYAADFDAGDSYAPIRATFSAATVASITVKPGGRKTHLVEENCTQFAVSIPHSAGMAPPRTRMSGTVNYPFRPEPGGLPPRLRNPANEILVGTP